MHIADDNKLVTQHRQLYEPNNKHTEIKSKQMSKIVKLLTKINNTTHYYTLRNTITPQEEGSARQHNMCYPQTNVILMIG